MHTRSIPLVTVMILVVSLFASAAADVPRIISYQGRLTDDAGAIVPDGPYLVKFKIYGSATGEDSLWYTDFQSITVTDGLFSHQLGSAVPLPPDLFSTDTTRYLGITVDGDPEMSPRTRLVGVPYAFHAGTADPSTPIIWSGGCTSHGQAADWNVYCTDGVDFSNVDGFLSVSPDGTFTVLTAGYYRINAWAGNYCNSSRRMMIRRNGSPIHYETQTNTGAGWRTLSADVTWHFDAGDTFEVAYYNDGGGYAYHAWSPTGQHSRLQVTYVGP